ncbi:MAG: hypothetical protein OHK0038_09810 [Flammeovirgaceae bacterium]
MIHAQNWDVESYYGVPVTEKKLIFWDDFVGNKYEWYNPYDATFSLGKAERGRYILQSYNEYMQVRYNSIYIDDANEDFEIEAKIKFISGGNYGNCLYWGGGDGKDFRFTFSGNGYYMINSYDNGEWINYVDWTQSSLVKTTEYNKLTVRKVGYYDYFFLNEELVFSMEHIQFYGSQFGFAVAPNSTINIDDIKISILQSSGKQQVVEENTDYTPPLITITSPNVSRGFKVVEANQSINVVGKAVDESGVKEVFVNGAKARLESNGNFQAQINLIKGDNLISVKATDNHNNQGTYTFYIAQENQKVDNNNNSNIAQEDNTSIVNEKRIALIIGNANYVTAPLKNPVNDANTMAKELKALGFEVITLTNASYQAMKKGISDFGKKLGADKNSVGLFYYAGHGIQLKGKNYLVPTDAVLETEADVEVYAVDMEGLLANMEYAANRMNIIILDACRNNPFGRGFRSTAGNGLATVNAPTGTIIAFATSPGSTAADGEGSNGLYTQELVNAMKIPNIKLEDVFKRVRTQVRQKSSGSQIPWENSALEGDFYFKK